MTEQSFLPKISLIDRDNEITLLLEKTREVIAGERRVVYFEARGGLGKTRLLHDYPVLVRNSEGNIPVLVADIIDMYAFENRKPIEFGWRIVNSLIAAAKAHGLADTIIDAIFSQYRYAYDTYHTIRGYSHQATRDAEEGIHKELVKACNALANYAPLALRFDNFEEILNAHPPKFAFVYDRSPLVGDHNSREAADATSINSLVLRWFYKYIPTLEKTLILIAGRPSKDSKLDWPVGINMITCNLKAITSKEGYVAFLKAQRSVFRKQNKKAKKHSIDTMEANDDLVPYIQSITGGLPLMITLFAQAWMREILRIPPEQSTDKYPPGNSYELEDRLITQIFSLLNRPRPTQPSEAVDWLQQYTFIFCLFILSCARRGIRRRDLYQVFDNLKIEYDRDVIQNLEDEALVKSTTSGVNKNHNEDSLLFLHDEIQALIDQSRKLDQLNYRKPILEFLCKISNAEATKSGNLQLKLFSDHLYYELTRDIDDGYRTYIIYTDRLLRQRYIQDALILAEIFWNTLLYQIDRGGEIEWPLLDQLAESEQLTISDIERDEEVRYLKRLRFSDEHAEAVARAQITFAAFVPAGVFPVEQQEARSEEVTQVPAYFICDLLLTQANALIRSQADLKLAEETLNTLLSQLILLEAQPAPTPDTASSLFQKMMYQRRLFFLGEAYNTRGQLFGEKQYFQPAVADLERSIDAFTKYKESGAARVINDDIERDIAQAYNNLAYRFIDIGDLEGALERSNFVLREYVEKGVSSAYQTPLFYNTNALILMQLDKHKEAKQSLDQAKATAQKSGVDRVQGLVTWADAKYLRAEWNAHRQSISINEAVKIEEENFKSAVNSLKGEPRTQSEILHDRARLMRDLVVAYESEGEKQRSSDYWNKAKTYLEEAIKYIDKGPTLNMRHANICATFASLYLFQKEWAQAAAFLDQADKLLAEMPDIPRYAQVVAGKIAFQRGLLLLQQDKPYEGLAQLVTALARVYYFARSGPVSREQLSLEHQIRCLVEDNTIPTSELKYFLPLAHTDSQVLPTHSPAAPKTSADEWVVARDRALKFFQSLLVAIPEQKRSEQT